MGKKAEIEIDCLGFIYFDIEAHMRRFDITVRTVGHAAAKRVTVQPSEPFVRWTSSCKRHCTSPGQSEHAACPTLKVSSPDVGITAPSCGDTRLSKPWLKLYFGARFLPRLELGLGPGARAPVVDNIIVAGRGRRPGQTLIPCGFDIHPVGLPSDLGCLIGPWMNRSAAC